MMAGGLTNLDLMERYASLGPDFLTWLAARGQEGSLPAIPSEPELSVEVKGPMLFEAAHGEATKVTLAGDEAATAPEVDAALKVGKRLRRAKFEFSVVDATWAFTLDGETFDIKSVKLPVPKIADENEYLKMRVQALQHLTRLIEELFEAFLVTRLEPSAWKEEVVSWTRVHEA
ncbi:MAG: hypothetical protein PWP23_3250 [Candidatus Sumerlaeota bacterium]|nr:hypothetical protein [Candidatus Sumerlaeota bacterium]